MAKFPLALGSRKFKNTMSHYAYYNDNDPYVCAWLENLIDGGHIAKGDVDCRPIEKVQPSELEGYTQCHFFAGIGGWSYGLRLAGWKDEWPIWTGSCPCQPFSVAGKRKGTKDKRHLWPELNRLIAQCNPPIVAGEQVASKAGRLWLSRVRSDLEASGYEVGTANLCSLPIGAVHQRNRLYFVADADQARLPFRGEYQSVGTNAYHIQKRTGSRKFFEGVVSTYEWNNQPCLGRGVYGIPSRVATVQAFGNSIVPQVASEFISAYLEARTMAPCSGLGT